MEIINCKKKSIIEININGTELIASADMRAIDHFQKSNNGKTFLGEFTKMSARAEKNNMDVDVVILMRLAGSMFCYKKTGNPVGFSFFNQFDVFDMMNILLPIVVTLINSDMPKAEGEEEKN